ncbi:DUF1016 family protein [Burkholderia multivorans]|nr:DUF1016 family protein [Burkholderia multivorans]
MTKRDIAQADYVGLHREIADVVASARAAAARSVNALMTATYWEIGRRIVEFEQGGEGRATYGEAVPGRRPVSAVRPRLRVAQSCADASLLPSLAV